MLDAALDAFGIGIVVCDDAGRVVFANAVVRENAQGPLRLSGKVLSAATSDETRAMMRLIRDAARGSRWGAIALADGDARGTVPVLITPLTRAGEDERGYVLLAIGESGQNPWVTEATLGKLYHLSRTQGAIAIAIFNGQSPEDIASERGIKISTVRTHLADIFLRTRTKTQRDLIRLLGSLPPLR